MEENDSFIHYQRGHDIDNFDQSNKGNPDIKLFFNVDDGEQFYEAGCYKNDICD